MLRRPPARERCSLGASAGRFKIPLFVFKDWESVSATVLRSLASSREENRADTSPPFSSREKQLPYIIGPGVGWRRRSVHVAFPVLKRSSPARGDRSCLGALKPMGLSAYQRAIGKSAGKRVGGSGGPISAAPASVSGKNPARDAEPLPLSFLAITFHEVSERPW